MKQVFSAHELCKQDGPLGPYFDSYEAEMRGKVDSSHAAGPDLMFDSESASDKLGDIHFRPSFGLKGHEQRRFFT